MLLDCKTVVSIHVQDCIKVDSIGLKDEVVGESDVVAVIGDVTAHIVLDKNKLVRSCIRRNVCDIIIVRIKSGEAGFDIPTHTGFR